MTYMGIYTFMCIYIYNIYYTHNICINVSSSFHSCLLDSGAPPVIKTKDCDKSSENQEIIRKKTFCLPIFFFGHLGPSTKCQELAGSCITCMNLLSMLPSVDSYMEALSEHLNGKFPPPVKLAFIVGPREFSFQAATAGCNPVPSAQRLQEKRQF